MSTTAVRAADLVDMFGVNTHKRTSKASMRAAVIDVVAPLDRHGNVLTRPEAISVLGFVIGTFASVWGREEEIVGKPAEVAKAVVLKRRAITGVKPPVIMGLLMGRSSPTRTATSTSTCLGEMLDAAALEDLRNTLARYAHGMILTEVERTEA